MTQTNGGPVVALSASPHAVLRPVAIAAVQLEDAFWQPRIARNREMTIPAQLRQCEETGRIDNFRRASGRKQVAFQGIFFNDSDVYKWAEAAAFSLGTHPDPKLDADLDAVIDEIAAAQDANGYLNTYFMFEREPERFTNLKDMHEIYCAGHLMQVAVAHHRATGKTTLLEVAIKLADCLDATFGPEPEKRLGACGHEEAEMALVELYRETGEARYLRLARFMIEARGHKPGLFGNSAYHQDHLPFVQQKDLTGHAVRHLYLACGGADVALETGDPPYRSALEALWKSLTEKRMYVTGGAGSRWEGEAFGEDYELPNDRAYTETCAAIGSVMWNWRMLHLTGDALYADLMETTLYNAVLPGLSLDGTHYYYQNPLADRGAHRRQEWFGCACCPPNIARLLASLGGYFYSVDATGVYVNLYATGTATLLLAGGRVTLSQKTNYPWDGDVKITIDAVTGQESEAKFLNLRLPCWANDVKITVDGQPVAFEGETGQYARIPMPEAGKIVRLALPMTIEKVESHPHVLANRNRVALRRGPLVYCIEQADNPDADVWDMALPADVELSAEFDPDLLGGIVTLKGQALARDAEEWEGALYAPYRQESRAGYRPVALTAIPYYAWANREPGPMQVWIPVV